MKIFSATQFKAWDQYTIVHDSVASINLMERAAMACCNWITTHLLSDDQIKIFCGKGNNGGDGLAVARLLHQIGWNISIYIIDSTKKGTEDFEINFIRLQTLGADIHFIASPKDLPVISDSAIIIDALFGTGLNKPIDGLVSSLIDVLNESGNRIISIDLPSGLFTDKCSIGNKIVKAINTLSFQSQKLCFMMPENGSFIGKVTILPIGLNEKFYSTQQTSIETIGPDLIQSIYKPRDIFSHKGRFGYACIIAGSQGMMGAAVLATRACMKSGAGKVVCITPGKGNEIMQISIPEAMTVISGDTFINDLPAIELYDAIGIGPGLGIHRSHKKLLFKLFNEFKKPIVVDADALNVISGHRKLLKSLPPNSIITPHPAEFDRLFGKSENDFERMDKALEKSQELSIYIVLKGHHTLVTTPEKKGYFNSTGNPGMATGGSGDVLTGILTGLLAQQYPALEACLLGIYLHGLAGDIAAVRLSEEAMLASDIITHLGDAFNELR